MYTRLLIFEVGCVMLSGVCVCVSVCFSYIVIFMIKLELEPGFQISYMTFADHISIVSLF